MKKLLLLLVTMLVATSAFAVLDPEPDRMGLYFDLEADVSCLEDVAPFSTHDMHLILTRPTADMIYGFEAGHTMDGQGLILGLTFAVPNNFWYELPDNIFCGYGAPQPTSLATLLVTFNVMYLDTYLGPLNFTLHGTTPSSMDPAYPTILLSDGVLISTPTSTPYGPTAQFNGGCTVVSTEKVSFDSIKSLYR